MSNEPVFAYAQINARVQPMDRGDRYEDPLSEALEPEGWAEVTGGGTMLGDNEEIDYIGVDLDLFDVRQAVPVICQVLSECGAPKGSTLQFEWEGKKHEIPFGILEGVAIYFNGTDLPAEVYEQCDINHAIEQIIERLGERGEIQGYWEGEKETALYLYGYTVAEMKTLIAPFMAEYPLCQKVRYEVIA